MKKNFFLRNGGNKVFPKLNKMHSFLLSSTTRPSFIYISEGRGERKRKKEKSGGGGREIFLNS